VANAIGSKEKSVLARWSVMVSASGAIKKIINRDETTNERALPNH